jgi:Fe2+-dicitrate sensor, membrane component
MHNLVLKYIDNTLTPEESNELYHLVLSDDRVKEDFISAQNICALTTILPYRDDEILATTKLQKLKKGRSHRSIMLPLKAFMRYAVVFCLAVLSTWYIMGGNIYSQKDFQVSYEEFSTPPGQRASIKLYDGTTVWLNANSTLRYPNVFTNGERRVELYGEAFFDVVHDEKKAFVVSTNKIDVKALGTRFNVSSYGERYRFQTFLEEGSVKVYNRDDETNAMFLTPGEAVEVKDSQFVRTRVANKDFLLWKDGIYAFDDLAFKEIVEKLELYYDVKINVTNEELAMYKLSGKFRQRDGVTSALRTFQKLYIFSFNKDDELNQITIK